MKLAYLFPEHLGLHRARILQIAPTLAALARRGVEVHFIVGWFAGLEGRLEELGLNGTGLVVHAVPMWQKGPGLPLPLSWHGVYQAAALHRLDGLTRGGGGWAVLVRHLKLAAHLVENRKKFRAGLMFEAHEVFSQTGRDEGHSEKKIQELEALERRVFGGVDRLAAISVPLARELEARPEVTRPVGVAMTGVGDRFFAVERRRVEPDLAVYAGGLTAWKGVDLLLRAAAGLPRARVEILGGSPEDGDWRRLENLGRELGLGNRLLMRPRAGQDAVAELLSRAGAAVWPGTARSAQSSRFTSPLKLMEYLAAGCPVAAPDLPTATSVLTGGRDALFYRPDDPVSLAAVLDRIMTDRNLAEDLGRGARELARNYTWDNRAAVLMDMLEEIKV